MQQSQNASPQRSVTKAARQSGWKQKMQVRMIERPGEVVCPASPFAPPKPLPFQVTSLKRSTLLAIQMQDMKKVLGMVSDEQAQRICETMATEHRNILLSVQPKAKEPKGGGAPGDTSSRESGVEAEPEVNDRRSTALFDEHDFSEKRLRALEVEIDRCITSMSQLHEQAKAIPRMVQALSTMQGKPLHPMPPAAQAALKPSAQRQTHVTTTIPESGQGDAGSDQGAASVDMAEGA